MAVPTTIADLSATAASNSPAGTDSIGTSLDDFLRSIQAIIKQGVSKGSDITAASTIACANTASYFVVTGTTGITAIANADWEGRIIVLKFSGALTLTHSAGLILPGAADFTTVAGDVLAFVYESTGVWRCVKNGDFKADGSIPMTGNLQMGANDIVFTGKTMATTSQILGGFKNKIINGRFQINQRAYASGATLAAGSYGHDCWKAGASGGDYSFTQNAADTTITIASGKSLIQVIEDANVSDTAFVLSWSGTAQARYAVDSATPSGSYAASPILITGQTVGTTMSVEFNAGTLGDVQLEAGSVSTPFEARSIGEELALCQRYAVSYNSCIIGRALSASVLGGVIFFPQPMRAAPTLSGSASFVASAGSNGTVALNADATTLSAEFINSAANWTSPAQIKLTALLTSEL